MKRWQMTTALVGLALGALALAPRLFGTTTPIEPLAPPVSLPTPEARTPQGSLQVTALTDQSTMLQGDASDHFVTIEVSALHVNGLSVRRPVDLAIVLDTSGSMNHGKLEKAKEATLALARSLAPDDTLSIVAFAGQARTVLPARSVNSNAVERALDPLVAHGGTNLYGGLALGGQSLSRRPDAVQRVVLLSDGNATEGELRPEAFDNLATSLSASGASISTVGLGSTYNEDHMARLADLGGGRYDDIADASQIASVFQEEFTRSSTVMARDTRVTITLPEGMTPIELLGWSGTRVDGGWSVYLGDVYAGETRKIVARVQTAEMTSAGDVRAIATYHDSLDARSAQSSDIAGVTLTASPAQAAASIDPEASAMARRTYGNWYLEMATRSYAEGRREDSLDLIDRGRRFLEASAEQVPMPSVVNDLERFDDSRRMYAGEAPSAPAAMRHVKDTKERFRAIAR